MGPPKNAARKDALGRSHSPNLEVSEAEDKSANILELLPWDQEQECNIILSGIEVKTNMDKPLQKLFAEVAPTYEMVNHVLTFGLDRRWRKKAARLAAARGGFRWLDVCSGTGEFAGTLAELAPRGGSVISLDFCPPMLARATARAGRIRLLFVIGNARHLPFATDSLDLITISFATRNINLSRPILVQEFAEFRRVLKPEGTFVNLETSQPRPRWIRSLFHVYVSLVVKYAGRWLSGSRAGYVYLASTIPRFHDARELKEIIDEAGLDTILVKRLSLGIAAIHVARKPGVHSVR